MPKSIMSRADFEDQIAQVTSAESVKQLEKIMTGLAKAATAFDEQMSRRFNLALRAQQDYLDELSRLQHKSNQERHDYIEFITTFDFDKHIRADLNARKAVINLSEADIKFYVTLITTNKTKLAAAANSMLNEARVDAILPSYEARSARKSKTKGPKITPAAKPGS